MHCPGPPIKEVVLLPQAVLNLMDHCSVTTESIFIILFLTEKQLKKACKTVLWRAKGAKQRLLAWLWFLWSMSLSVSLPLSELETKCNCYQQNYCTPPPNHNQLSLSITFLIVSQNKLKHSLERDTLDKTPIAWPATHFAALKNSRNTAFLASNLLSNDKYRRECPPTGH